MLVAKLFRISGRYLSNPLVWFAMAILALLAFFSGPFGTFLFMDEPVRLVYWSLKILILGVVATFFFAFIEVQKTSNLMAIIALSVGFGALAGFVTMLICLALGQPIEDLETIFWIFFYIGPSSSLSLIHI